MRLTLIISLFLSLASFGQTLKINGAGNAVSINKAGTPGSITINKRGPYVFDYTKNVQVIEDHNFYDAFGVGIRTGENRISYYYRQGTSHREDGIIAARHLDIEAKTWSPVDTIYIDPDDYDMRDVWGGNIDGDSIALFSTASELTNGNTVPNMHPIIIKGDLNNNFGAARSLYSGSIDEFQLAVPFGVMQKGNAPGTYYMAFYQINSTAGTTDKPTFPLYSIDVLKTTDNWNTWTIINVVETATAYSECVFVVYPDDNNKMSMAVRRDVGYIRLYESSNGGSTWTDRGNVAQVSYNGVSPKVPFGYVNMNGLWDLAVQDRSDGWLKISRNNHWSEYFGTNDPHDAELWYFNRVGSLAAPETYRLGYMSFLELDTGKYFFIFTKQFSTEKANLYWTLDDLNDDAGPPVAPPFLISNNSSLTTTNAFVYCATDYDGGYTLEQLANIRWFEWAISTDNFATFTTARVRFSAGEGSYSGVINNYRLHSHFLNIYELTPATNYKVRCRAVNTQGASAWTEISFTTDTEL